MICLWSLWHLHKDENESPANKHIALVGLMRLLGGEVADTVDWSSPSFSTHLKEMHDHVHELMEGTVEGRLEKWYSDATTSFNFTSKWTLISSPKSFTFSETQLQFLDRALSNLANLCVLEQGDLKLCYKASLERGYGSRSKNCHEYLDIGDIIQLLIVPGSENHTFIDRSHSTRGVPHYFVLGGFFRLSSEQCWAVIRECSVLFPGSICQLPRVNQTPVLEVSTTAFYERQDQPVYKYLSLTSNVIKVGVIHNCSADGGSCDFSTSNNGPIHSSDTLKGGRFFVLTRSMAYPPRRS